MDIEACRRSHGWFMEWFMDPVFKGVYPQFLVDWFAQKGAQLDIQAGDMELIAEPIDILGINYHIGTVARFKENQGLFDCEHVDIGYDRTDIGFKIYPDGFYKVLVDIKNKYGDIPIFITENGACYNDEPVDGRVQDDKRIRYYQQHLTELSRAIQSGVNIKGYCTWSLLDNFEWAFGYTKRFGLVHVNYNTLERTKKDSYYWLKSSRKIIGLKCETN
ncbi:family 1 glycosylhydrolase [Lederbergia ruris]|uniref:family 1 glycosylhydrolase n=1 Tax=Lederbergia ruris TaxID=217495 RepID=UPI0039A15EA4